MDCFVGERKNCSLRAVANIVKNARCWERSVLFRAMAAQLARLTNRPAANMLHPKVSVSRCGSVRTSSSATVCGVRLRKGDAVKVSGRVLLLQGFQIDDAHGLRVCCDAYESRERVDSHASVFACTSANAFSSVSSFQVVHLYYKRCDGRIVVLD